MELRARRWSSAPLARGAPHEEAAIISTSVIIDLWQDRTDGLGDDLFLQKLEDLSSITLAVARLAEFLMKQLKPRRTFERTSDLTRSQTTVSSDPASCFYLAIDNAKLDDAR